MKAILLIIMIIGQIDVQPDQPETIEIVFHRIYTTGRGPCQFLADGSRRWAITTGFKVTKLLKGDLQTKYVEVPYDIDKQKDIQFLAGQKYTVIMKLTEKRWKELDLDKANTIMSYRNPINANEITTIEFLK